MRRIKRMTFVLLMATLMGIGLSGAAFAERPITFGYDGIAKIGEKDTTFMHSPGRHPLAFISNAPYYSDPVAGVVAVWES